MMTAPRNPDRSGQRTVKWVCALMFVLAVTDCGVDSGGTGAPTSSFASGPITGFGSVIVHRVHFDDSHARVADADGNLRSPGDLRLGMTTEIYGSAVVTVATGSTSIATSIIFASAIVGRVDNIDSAAATLVVLGQTVVVTPTTVFDNSLTGGLAGLSIGDVIEVYALVDAASGSYRATRVDRKTSVAAYQLRGIVSNLDTVAKTFKIGVQQISYANLQGSEVPNTLGDGRFVRVQLQIVPAGGVWLATRLQDSVPVLQNQSETLLEGLISKFTSNAQFTVNGIDVDASRASFPTGSIGLGLGVRVAIEGTAVGKVLSASTVQIRTEADVATEGFELDGAIASIDTVNGTFVLFGLTVAYAGSAFVGGTISDLAAGKNIELTGTLSTDGTQLQAVQIRFLP